MQDDRFDALTRLLGARRSRHVIGVGGAADTTSILDLAANARKAAGKVCRSTGAPCRAGSCCASSDPCSVGYCTGKTRRRRGVCAGAPALADGDRCRLADDGDGTCQAGVCTPIEEPGPGCLAGGETCPPHPTSGLADYSTCCSGSGISTPRSPCQCCEPGRDGTREIGERCYPASGNQCCTGTCVPGEHVEVGVCG